MSRRDFESIMLSTRTPLSVTVRRLNDGEFRAFISMLCLAGDARPRGVLVVGGIPVTDDEIADFAKCKPAAVRSAIDKLVAMETLSRLDDGTLTFTNWDRLQPSPKPSDAPEATRERKQAQRDRARDKQGAGHGDVTRDIAGPVTPPSRVPLKREEKERKTTPPTPPAGGARQREKDRYETEFNEWCAEYFPGTHPGFVKHAVTFVGREADPTVANLTAFLADQGYLAGAAA